MLVKVKISQFLTFVLAGGTAAMFNFITRIFLSNYYSYPVSIILSYIIGMIIAFSLNKLFVFKTDNRILRQLVWFTIVNVLGIAQTVLISVYLVDVVFPTLKLVWYPEEFAHFIGISIPTFTSYIGHRYLTFNIKNTSKVKSLLKEGHAGNG